MKKIFLTCLTVLFSCSLLAQEAETTPSPWSCNGVVGLNASATGLVNWAAGGNNNVNGVAFGKVRLLYSDKNLSWETNLNLEYGLSYIDQKNDAFQKSSDVIDFNTKLGWQFHKAWYLTASAGFKSQFAFGKAYDGTDAPDPIISKFLSPSYTDISVGLDWKPNSIFSLYLSPVAGKITTAYVGDAVENANPGLRQQMQEKYATWVYSKEANADGTYDKIYRNCKAELGLSFKGGINYAYKDLKIITTIGLFTPYTWDKIEMKDANGEFIGYRDNNRRFGNFDVDWDAAISYQFLKCLNVTLSTSLKYYNGVKIADKEGISAERVQFKGILGLGVGYSF
ncbi:MAG: DUF3078 domain-containing protein [Paludibacteraceae bacterium]|nr:DUF3078 domain-containing protein [Paludibacteraceae bacterium]MBQ5774347.1 DUF3078 domain-containing protein [Paludibacteraceae bacterium]